MLDHLHIQNYRLFKDLKIDKLGQVNLIAGKNNTGKTALLEALRIWASKGEISVLSNILFKRRALQINREIENILTIFKNFKFSIIINEISFRIRETNFIIDEKAIDNKRGRQKIIPLENLDLVSKSENPKDTVVYCGFNEEIIYDGWEKFTIEEEDSFIEILKLIQNNIVDYRIVNSQPYVRVSDSKVRQSIKSFGDGLGRIFMLGFCLVKSKNKILLIDEFEVGLHHSVQEQLWEIIFKYAKEWNIQVFVTTHSQDTVKAFYYVSSKEEHKDMGQYMRLQPSRTSGEIEAVIYTEGSLETAFDLNLETR